MSAKDRQDLNRLRTAINNIQIQAEQQSVVSIDKNSYDGWHDPTVGTETWRLSVPYAYDKLETARTKLREAAHTWKATDDIEEPLDEPNFPKLDLQWVRNASIVEMKEQIESVLEGIEAFNEIRVKYQMRVKKFEAEQKMAEKEIEKKGPKQE